MHVARPGDFWSGLVLAALGGYIVVESTHWVYTGPDGPGAGFFPVWYGLTMMVLSVVLVLRSMRGDSASEEPPSARTSRRRARSRSTGTRGMPRVHTSISWPGTRRAFTCWAALVVAVPLLKIAGFIATFALLTWFIVAVMFRQSQMRAWSIAIGGALLFYVIFDLGLGVSLPSGLWY